MLVFGLDCVRLGHIRHIVSVDQLVLENPLCPAGLLACVPAGWSFDSTRESTLAGVKEQK